MTSPVSFVVLLVVVVTNQIGERKRSFPHMGQAHSFQVGTKLSPLASPRHHRRRHIYRSSFGAAKIKEKERAHIKTVLQ